MYACAYLPSAWATSNPVPEQPISDVNLVNNSGYSQSKWISEKLLEIASRETALNPVIIRVGQLCGGLNGNWNVHEWFPALVNASQVIQGIPDNDGVGDPLLKRSVSQWSPEAYSICSTPYRGKSDH